MPKVQAILRVEFEAESSNREAIDLALDQVLLIQPSCRVISKTISEIDGQVVYRENHHPLNIIPETGGSSSNVIHGDTYRPDYSEQKRDRDRDRDRHHDRNPLIDSYRPTSPNHDPSSSGSIDSYRPTNLSPSDPFRHHPDRYELIHPSDPSSTIPASNDLTAPPTTPLGTRYDTLIDSMIFTTDPQFSRPKYKKHRIEHYSPPPASRRDRSASPRASSGLRRSGRLRAASERDICRSPSTGADVDGGRKVSFDEVHGDRLARWRDRRRGEEEDSAGDGRMRMRGRGRRSGGEVKPAPSLSLEVLAPRTPAKDPAGEKSKFEKQQDRHGIAEALRLRTLRSNQKIEKARLRFDKQRWGEGEGEVKQGARLDAIIDQISTFDFTTPSSTTNGAAPGRVGEAETGSHPPVETRKKKQKQTQTPTQKQTQQSVREANREKWNAQSRSRGWRRGRSVTVGDLVEEGAAASEGQRVENGSVNRTGVENAAFGDDEMQDISVAVKQEVQDSSSLLAGMGEGVEL